MGNGIGNGKIIKYQKYNQTSNWNCIVSVNGNIDDVAFITQWADLQQ